MPRERPPTIIRDRKCLWEAFRQVSRIDLNRCRRWIASIAALAVLASALAPAIAQALVASPHAWVEICSSDGSRWVRADAQNVKAGDGSERQDELPGSTHGSTCAFCISHAVGFALPAAETPARVAPALPQTWVDVATGAWPPARAAWSWPALRGPPKGLAPYPLTPVDDRLA